MNKNNFIVNKTMLKRILCVFHKTFHVVFVTSGDLYTMERNFYSILGTLTNNERYKIRVFYIENDKFINYSNMYFTQNNKSEIYINLNTLIDDFFIMNENVNNNSKLAVFILKDEYRDYGSTYARFKFKLETMFLELLFKV